VRSHHDPSRLDRAVLRTVAYSDVFDYPLTGTEVHRYLDGAAAEPNEIAATLRRLTPSRLCEHEGLVALPGRDEIFATRKRRQREAERLWPSARRWGRVLGRFPLIRMVAVTGALAVDNVDADADIDFLIVTVPSRVWLCRILVTQVVRAARVSGAELCPNWLLAADALGLDKHSLFAARELVQMVPLVGIGVYREMRRLNSWTDALLPNSAGPPDVVLGDDVHPGALTRTTEGLLRGRLGAAVDTWDRRRKSREILRSSPSSVEIVLDDRQCKGHVNDHGTRIRRAYAERLAAIGLEPSADA
jgi:hypothetical protein